MNDTTLAIDLAKTVFEVAVSTRPGAVARRRRREHLWAPNRRSGGRSPWGPAPGLPEPVPEVPSGIIFDPSGPLQGPKWGMPPRVQGVFGASGSQETPQKGNSSPPPREASLRTAGNSKVALDWSARCDPRSNGSIGSSPS
jgi:hypothetical protein